VTLKISNNEHMRVQFVNQAKQEVPGLALESLLEMTDPSVP